MADSAVEQIIAAVKTKLETITGIGEVSRDGIDALSIQRFPAVVISVGTDEANHLLNELIDHNLSLEVTGWVKTEVNVSKTLEAFKAQIREKMAADRFFGLPNKIDSYEEGANGPFPMNVELTEAAEGLRYRFRYRTSRTDPYTLIG